MSSTCVISFSSTQELASAMKRAEAAHGEHEEANGKADPDWPDWYAKYMVAEKAGGTARTRYWDETVSGIVSSGCCHDRR